MLFAQRKKKSNLIIDNPDSYGKFILQIDLSTMNRIERKNQCTAVSKPFSDEQAIFILWLQA